MNVACDALAKFNGQSSSCFTFRTPTAYLPYQVYDGLMSRADKNVRLNSGGLEELPIGAILTMLAVISVILLNALAAPLATPITLGVLAAVLIADVALYGHSQGWHHRLFSSGYKPEMSVAMNNLATATPREIPEPEWDHPDDVERERCLRQTREADERYGYGT